MKTLARLPSLFLQLGRRSKSRQISGGLGHPKGLEKPRGFRVGERNWVVDQTWFPPTPLETKCHTYKNSECVTLIRTVLHLETDQLLLTEVVTLLDRNNKHIQSGHVSRFKELI